MQGEGTWCAACQSPYHQTCIAVGTPCVNCGEEWKSPQQSYRYSALCPVCGKRNEPQQAECNQCGSNTRWDDEQAYFRRRAAVNSYGMTQLITGIALIIASLLFILLLFGILSLATAMFAIPAGVVRLRRGLRASKFY